MTLSERDQSAAYGQATAGHAVAVLHIPSRYALFPGNPQHAGSFPFPVLYEEVGLDNLDDLFCGAAYIEDNLVEASQRAIDKGARSIIGACGSFGYHQKGVASRVNVPVFLSILLQVPFLQRALGGDRLGVVCASASAMNDRIFSACGITDHDSLVVRQMIGHPEFDRFIANSTDISFEALQAETLNAAHDILREANDVRGIVLQCSDLAPFGRYLQHALGLPVYDASLLVRWAQSTAFYPPLPSVIW